MDVDILENYCIMGLLLNWTFPLDTECRFNVLCTLNLHTISKGLAIDTLLLYYSTFSEQTILKTTVDCYQRKNKVFLHFFAKHLQATLLESSTAVAVVLLTYFISLGVYLRNICECIFVELSNYPKSSLILMWFLNPYLDTINKTSFCVCS